MLKKMVKRLLLSSKQKSSGKTKQLKTVIFQSELVMMASFNTLQTLLRYRTYFTEQFDNISYVCIINKLPLKYLFIS